MPFRLIASIPAFLISGGQTYNVYSLLTNPNGVLLTGLDGINDNGDIVGSAFVNGNTHAILLTPVAVPEPSSLMLAFTGVSALFGLRWFRRNRVGSP